MHPTGPFSIPAIRNFVPEKLKPWVIILFVIVFQFSGGVYLAAVSEMVGSTALMQEDIMMAGYASMVGMALTFAIMFRLKFRFTSKVALLTCCTALIICNLISMYTRNVPVLIFACFIAGFFRMWGTFECNSTIQLWLTPKRDLSVFFCFIYFLVQGSIQLSGLATTYVTFFAKWEFMHWLIIGLLGSVMLLTVVLFRTCRTLNKLPLYGIDWLGGLLWGLILLSVIFICIYGEHYDWYASPYIRMATIAAIVMILLNVWRSSFIRHPFIAPETWLFKSVYMTFLLYIVIDLLLAPSHLFEHLYMEAILGYDALNTASLNWVVLSGVITGSLFTYQTFALRKWCYRTMTVIAFSAIVGYLTLFYFTIDYHLSKEFLIFPIFLRGFGYVIIAICFLTALSRVPFPNFFQSVSVQAFVSAGFGSVLGTAVLGQMLEQTVKKNVLLLGANLDHVNPLTGQIPWKELYGSLQQQALIVSLKELYGWLALGGILCLLLFMIKESNIRHHHAIHPTYRVIRRLIRGELSH